MKTNIHPRMPEKLRFPGRIRHARYFNMLSKMASEMKPEFNNNARMAACIIHKNEVIAIGFNEKKSHPFQAKYGKHEDCVYLHAETSAIKNAIKKVGPELLEECTLYICRVKYAAPNREKMVFGMAKPCTGCFRCINTFGIKKVIYTLDGFNYEFL